MRVLRALGALALTASLFLVPVKSLAALDVFVDIAPPAIPTYVQPEAPFVDAMWTPGYWAWGSGGYYWVPGTWVHAPRPGVLWTPGYWGWGGTGYAWHTGYWGPHVGFYGGINYGAGYWGNGFYGGAWRDGAFHYNTAVWNVNRTVIHNTYVDRTVVDRYGHNDNHVSYNGGKGGINAHESQREKDEREKDKDRQHRMTPDQQRHEDASSHDKDQYAKHNNGNPNRAATQHADDHTRDGAHEPDDKDKKEASSHAHKSGGGGDHHGGKP